MRRCLSAGLVAVAALAGGCNIQFGNNPGPKTASPKSDAGLRPERAFRKSPNKPVTPEQTATFAFLDDDKQRFQAATGGLAKKAKPSEVTAALTKYADEFDKADKAALPAELTTELTHYREAYRALIKVLTRLPDGSYDGTRFYDLLSALFRGDIEGGKALGGDVVDAVQATRTALGEVYKTAAQYSLDLDR